MSAKGHVWAIDAKDKIWYRKGASSETVMGNTWKVVSGSLKQVNPLPVGLHSALVLANHLLGISCRCLLDSAGFGASMPTSVSSTGDFRFSFTSGLLA